MDPTLYIKRKTHLVISLINNSLMEVEKSDLIIYNDIRFLLFATCYFTASPEEYEEDRSLGNHYLILSLT